MSRIQNSACVLCAAVFLFLLPISLVLLPYSPAYLIATHAAQKEVPFIANDERLVATEKIVAYLWTGSRYDLMLSDQANTHMADVRGIFIVGEVLALLSLALTIIFRKQIAQSHFRTAASIVATVTVGLAILCSFSFERAFTLFHSLLFRNDLWLFPSTDSLIQYFPSSFFVSMSVILAAVILVVNTLLVVFLAKGDARQRVGSGDPAQHI